MTAPFYNNIKGTTAGTPGTGAFTPNAAATKCFAWSTVPAGWHGAVLYEDGSDLEYQYSYWDGTTLSRGTNQFISSTTGSALTLTSAATAEMIIDAERVQPAIGSMQYNAYQGTPGSGIMVAIGVSAATLVGTAASNAIAATNYLTEQSQLKFTSATSANAQAGPRIPDAQTIYSTAAGRGGFGFSTRFGWSQLPTGPRVLMGLTNNTWAASTSEPSAFATHGAFLGKDSTDTNLQFMTNDNGTASKTDTGLAPVANAFYQFSLWSPPGGGKVRFRLIRLDTGAIFLAEHTTDLPANGSLLRLDALSGLSGTTGTAIIQHTGNVSVRSGSG